MGKKNRRLFWVGMGLLAAFVLWTLFVCFFDVRAIGPRESSVGFATLNGYVHNLTGVNMSLYVVTDWLGFVQIGVAFGFAALGLVQWIKRKSLLKVDRSIFTLGGFYIVVIVVYILFEIVVINYRPTLINGCLEVSYPSSTTMLVMCVMTTAIIQFRIRIKNDKFRRCIMFAITVFIAFMVIGRLVSGVHWITDIIGGVLLSTAIVLMYYSVGNIVAKNC